MAKIRKINISEIEGSNPGSNNAILPAGTITVYEDSGEYSLRIHNGQTDGGISFVNEYTGNITFNNGVVSILGNDYLNNLSYAYEFGNNGNLTFPQGSVISETDTTTVITPPGATAGQGLVIRTTAGGGLSTTDTFAPNSSMTITFTDNGSNFSTGGYVDDSESNTWAYTITGISQADLGSPLTGSFLAENWGVPSLNLNEITFNIPAESQGTGFTITLDKVITDPPYYLSGVNLNESNRISLAVGSSVADPEISHVHLTTADPVTVDLYLGDDNQYVKIEKNGGNVVIGTNVNTSHWVFGEDGTTTFPDNTIKSPGSLLIETPGSAASSVADWVGDGLGGWDQALYTNLATTGGTGTGLTVDVVGGSGYIDSNAITINNPGSGYTDGDVITITNENSYSGTFNIGVLSNTWNFSVSGNITFPDNTIQTTAYVENTTVAKTGAIIPTTTGIAALLAHDSVLTELTDASYGPFTLSNVTFNVNVIGGVIGLFDNVTSTSDVTVNDGLGTIDSGDIGGTAGTSITITVDGVVQQTRTALDLTKTINKLTSGQYTLADGYEGQIMYLVRQTSETNDGIRVYVTNQSRQGTNEYTNNYIDGINDVATLIFTDGAWQASSSATWD